MSPEKSLAPKWRNWLELLMPTVLVGLAWLGVSAATTAYISWLDRRHQAVMSENVASIRAAAEMQYSLWELQVAVVAATTPQAPDAKAANEFRAALAAARAAAITPEEQRIVARIRETFASYERELERSLANGVAPMPADRTAGLAAQIARLCDELRVINQSLIDQRTAQHRRWSDRVVVARIFTMVAGPLIGVWLGYRVANRIRRRLLAIHVTLGDAVGELGQVVVEPTVADGNLDSIDRQVREVAGRLHDVVSELETARRDATRNERLAAVGQLAAGVAHELRNPLTAVKLLVQTAAHRAEADGLCPESLAVVQDEIARMETTIQSLLDFARPSASRRVPCDLRAMLRRAVNLVQGRADQQQVPIELLTCDEAVLVTCDPEQLHQVFVNLLLNGLEATTSHAPLTVSLRRPPAEKGQAACEVVVTDHGEGIPPQLLDHIFEPFVTTKPRGTGLGLAISRRLVEEHGGRLTANNRPDHGAEFTVWLPCAAAAANAA